MNHKKQEKNNILVIVITVLLIVIIGLLAYIAFGWEKNGEKQKIQQTTNAEDITITVISDARCTNCYETDIENQLKQVPALAWATFENKDFSDEWIEAYLKENNIGVLPAFIFSTKNINDPELPQYLMELPDNSYSLQIGAQFNPFAERSENGFLLLDKEVLQKIIDESYIYGEKDTPITWLEFSDLECPYCAKLHNAGTIEAVFENYDGQINKIFHHFPLDFHQNAQTAGEILECVWELSGSDNFYALIKSAYTDEVSDKDSLLTKAEELGVNKADIETCLDEGRYTQKVKEQMQEWASLFGITGTPGNILINTETGEYEVISGAFPTEAFIEVIDKLNWIK